jgi:hypothetical protein
MHSVCVGIVGAVLGVAPALANEPACRATRAVVKTIDSSESPYGAGGTGLKRPDLVGKEFRITRITRLDKMRQIEPGDYLRNQGHETVELMGKTGRFILRVDYLPRTTPAVGISSWAASSSGAPAFDGAPYRKAKVQVGDQYAHFISDGPLANMSLSVVACR